MSVLLDLVGSFVLATLLAFNLMQMSDLILSWSHQKSLDYLAQCSAVVSASFVEEDLRKVGYGVSGTAILQAESNRIRFLSDLGNDGTIDTLHYHVSNTATASDTPNPNDVYLYRDLNSTGSEAMRLGITQFQLSYFDASGNLMAQPVVKADVRGVRVDLCVESPMPYDTAYARTLMRFAVRPKNL